MFLPERQKLKQFLDNLFEKEGRSINSINYIFCGDDFLLSLNKTYLKHRTLTDIITFELSEKKHPVLSDIYISIDRVRENAKIFNTTFKKEVHRVVFHGALHLCGYKDKTKDQVAVMREKEEEYLSLYFVSRETTSKL